ncbi:hypothetical protein [Chitinophaga barathri]|uniref:Uncharacterized protein n=1 Tax=Chitinophaga barathri TaxID=1647451 RepID=A0A3N4M8Z8_9BACT|nr:hypothetical protein [Chitinophaga barathri]RPD39961.1 hypothetical protein EG028_17720 [Chitinophaga barathri]
MGTQTGILKFTGRLGNVIGYRVGGKYHLRTMPEQVRQSPRSKASSRQFGKASKLGAAMRHALTGLTDIPHESTLVNRLNKALLGVLREDDLHRTKRFIPRHTQGLTGFCLTPHAGLSRLLTVTPDISRDNDGIITVSIPAMETFNSNPQATHLSIKAVVVNIHHGCTAADAITSEPVLLEAGRPSDAFTLQVPAQPDAISCVLLEVISLRMENGRMYQLQNRKYTAAEVIAVLPPQQEPRAITYSWDAMQVQYHNHPIPCLPGMIIHSPQRE